VDVVCASLNVLCASYRVQYSRCLFPYATWTYWSEKKRYSLWGRQRIVIWNLLQSVQCAIHFIVHQIRYVMTWLLSGGKRTEETALRIKCRVHFRVGRTIYKGKLSSFYFDSVFDFGIESSLYGATWSVCPDNAETENYVFHNVNVFSSSVR
jgi:hypothetical protein